MHHFFDLWTVSEMVLEVFLGVCIKLFCDNGRIHWRDFVNDFFFWVPGFKQLPADGLTRQVAAMIPAVPVADQDTALPIAAK